MRVWVERSTVCVVGVAGSVTCNYRCDYESMRVYSDMPAMMHIENLDHKMLFLLCEAVVSS